MASTESESVFISNSSDSDSVQHSTVSDTDRLLYNDPESSDVTTWILPRWKKWILSLSPSRLQRRRRQRRGDEGSVPCSEKSFQGRRKRSHMFVIVVIGILAVLGIVQLFAVLRVLFIPDEIHRILKVWGQPGQIGEGLSSWPTDFSRGIIPIPCHSHNDYWRPVPLYSAINAGCIGVEADVWLIDEELYVGHSRASLTSNRTFASLYVDPILEILRHQNPTTSFHPDGNSSLDGVFDTTPEQSLILLIDFKTPGPALWPHVLSALEPLRTKSYLTHFNGTDLIQGPVTVVGTGNTPFDLVLSKMTNPHLDVFFDAPLDDMWEGKQAIGGSDLDEDSSDMSPSEVQTTKKDHVKSRNTSGSSPQLESGLTARFDMGNDESGRSSSLLSDTYNSTNSYYASCSFIEAIGYPWQGQLSDKQIELIRGQIRGAHERGLKARYWELPSWPIGLRNHIWDFLVKEGLDLLNVDDLEAATRRDWSKTPQWWKSRENQQREDAP